MPFRPLGVGQQLPRGVYVLAAGGYGQVLPTEVGGAFLVCWQRNDVPVEVGGLFLYHWNLPGSVDHHGRTSVLELRQDVCLIPTQNSLRHAAFIDQVLPQLQGGFASLAIDFRHVTPACHKKGR